MWVNRNVFAPDHTLLPPALLRWQESEPHGLRFLPAMVDEAFRVVTTAPTAMDASTTACPDAHTTPLSHLHPHIWPGSLIQPLSWRHQVSRPVCDLGSDPGAGTKMVRSHHTRPTHAPANQLQSARSLRRPLALRRRYQREPGSSTAAHGCAALASAGLVSPAPSNGAPPHPTHMPASPHTRPP